MPTLLFQSLAALSAALLLATAPVGATQQPAGDAEALMERAYERAFNLAHDEAISLAREAVAIAPDSSRAHRTLASLLWQKILFLRGAVTIDHYMSGMSDAQQHLPDPPVELTTEFQAELALAKALAEARLAREPDSLEAQYDVGAAFGLDASYTASVEDSLRAAYRTAKRAFDAQEAVLEKDPSHAPANVVVGTYRYMVSRLGLPTRWLAYLAGFGGGTERGISMIERALEDGGATMEAGTALLLIYSRESRHEEAYRLALRLIEQFPDNRILVLEAGAAAARAGLAGEAERLLAGGLARLAEDSRPKIPGERAIWLYQLGQARLQLNRPELARDTLQEALSSDPRGWMRGRILVGLGKLDDLSGHREGAVARYREARSLCAAFDDVICEDEARRLERRPFRMNGSG